MGKTKRRGPMDPPPERVRRTRRPDTRRGRPSGLGAAGVSRPLAISVLARLPEAMLSVGLLVQSLQLSGSFAVAGAVSGAYALALGIGGPLLGRIVDRRGQTLVLVSSAVVGAALLVAVAALPPGVSPALLFGLAVGIGLATPPVGACMRTLLAELLSDAAARRVGYAFESTALELTFISGPPLVLGLGAVWSMGAALITAGLVLLLATLGFAAEPASRAWRPAAAARSGLAGSLRAPALRTLVLVLLALGAVFGAVEVGVTASAKALDHTVAAGPLLAIWGVGSLAGGAVAARRGGGARRLRGFTVLLLALTVFHGALAACTRSIPALAVVLFLAGATIAPTYATVYAMVEGATPRGTVTEAFTWLSTAVAAGAAAGAAAAGVLVDTAAPAAAFLFAGAAGAMAVVLTLALSSTLAALQPGVPALPPTEPPTAS
jgi:MFS family permease